MANIVRLDIVEGNPRTFVAPSDLENGYFLEITGKAKNEYLDEAVDYEAFEVKLATADTKRGLLLFHKSPENQYDERLMKKDFVLGKGKVGRGYQLVLGDTVTIPVEMCGATVDPETLAVTGLAVKNEVKLDADGKLVKTDAGDGIAVVEAIENIEVPLYGGQWGADVTAKDIIQVSAVLRFF